MENRYDRLGDLLRDRLSTDDDPFESWDPHTGNRRQAGNARQRMAAPVKPSATRRVAVPEELIEDFRVLGLPPGVCAEDCKSAWRHLLKKHHPDANSGNGETEEMHAGITRRLNESYRRIILWYETGTI